MDGEAGEQFGGDLGTDAVECLEGSLGFGGLAVGGVMGSEGGVCKWTYVDQARAVEVVAEDLDLEKRQWVWSVGWV